MSDESLQKVIVEAERIKENVMREYDDSYPLALDALAYIVAKKKLEENSDAS